MSFLPIRYSASGPIIGNNDGGEATPGEGFPLRIVDNQASAGTLVFTSAMLPVESASGDFIMALTNPRPGLRYSVHMGLTIRNTGAAVATFAFNTEFRVDGGAWTELPTNQRYGVQQASATNASIMVSYTSPLILGADLPDPVLVSSSLLEARVVGLASVGNGDMIGNTLFGRIMETL